MCRKQVCFTRISNQMKCDDQSPPVGLFQRAHAFGEIQFELSRHERDTLASCSCTLCQCQTGVIVERLRHGQAFGQLLPEADVGGYVLERALA